MTLFTCGDFCPILGLTTDTKYHKLAPDTQYIKQARISQINIYYVQYSHIFYIAQCNTYCSSFPGRKYQDSTPAI